MDPTGRRLILVVSDCVSNIWRNGQAFSLLKTWGKYNIMAIIQISPRRLWLRTALSLGAIVQLDCLQGCLILIYWLGKFCLGEIIIYKLG